MAQCLVGIPTKRGRFEFWYNGLGDWRDEMEFEDVEIIDLFLRRQMLEAVRRRRRRKRWSGMGIDWLAECDFQGEANAF